MVNTKIELITFFVDKDGEAIQSAKTRPDSDHQSSSHGKIQLKENREKQLGQPCMT